MTALLLVEYEDIALDARFRHVESEQHAAKDMSAPSFGAAFLGLPSSASVHGSNYSVVPA